MNANLHSISAVLRRDPKRTWVLITLVAVMGAMWARLVFSGPHISAAAPTAGTEPELTLPVTGPAHVGRPAGASLAEWAQQTSKNPPRNLFAVPYGQYPADPAHPAQSGQKDADQAKSPAAQADQSKERQKLVEDLREQAAKMTLESTMPGTHPRAWIDGLLVGIGEPIGQTGFTLAKVETRRVFIEHDGVQIELSMK